MEKDTIDHFIDEACTHLDSLREAHGLTNSEAMGAVALILGSWIACYHQHFFRADRHATVGKYQRLIEASCNDAWQQLHTK